jgi:hypothetical protein
MASERVPKTMTGGCHCRAVEFEVDVEWPVVAQCCNCSMCLKKALIHYIVPSARFRLLHGADKLSSYSFNTHVAKHLFCSICGIHSFCARSLLSLTHADVPRSNPDGFSVNVRCVDGLSLADVTLENFDGAHWEMHAHTLAHLSKP